ncbi:MULTISPECIES: hypothetical protein [unclassified Pseudoalteromonas]|nr:hypothetical protein [Pseudoalteromonas sp. HL-AS1]WMS90910.1 hypothetical protein RB214_00335 [Pseudoalteromonas sp. HL-AS1]
MIKTINEKANFSSFDYSWTSIKELFYYQAQQLQGTFNDDVRAC